MIAHSIIWRRLDIPGRDACSLRQNPQGWSLVGTAELVLEGEPARVRYTVRCSSNFHTVSASLGGSIGARALVFEIERNAGHWQLNGVVVRGLEGCIDLDLGFTPATNLLPIRRLALALGEAASAPAAWLDVSRGSLETLPQWYERRAEDKYWYEAPSVDYAALLAVNAAGFVVDYPKLWRAEQQLATRERLALEEPPRWRVRRLQVGEVGLLRELRLAALRDSPDQLGEALADAQARSDQGWAELTASVTLPSVHTAYIAELGSTAIGMVYALTDRVDSTVGRLGGMWVRPSARGSGVGAALAQAVVEWCRVGRKRCIRLGVVPGEAAERLYRRSGFEHTFASKPFPGSESRRVLEMQLDLLPDTHSRKSGNP